LIDPPALTVLAVLAVLLAVLRVLGMLDVVPDAVGLDEAGLDAGAAVVIPAEQAASDRPAAQMARVKAAGRYLFMGFLRLISVVPAKS
jgi:hypothetical protein